MLALSVPTYGRLAKLCSCCFLSHVLLRVRTPIQSTQWPRNLMGKVGTKLLITWQSLVFQVRFVISRCVMYASLPGFCVTGGEPSTHPEFVSIVKHMCEATYFNYCTLSPCGVGASILTNGEYAIQHCALSNFFQF